MLAKHIAIVGTILSLTTSPALPQNPVEKARSARTLWSAFQCATYAEISGDVKEQERLFKAGFTAGRAFLDALENRQIPPEVARTEVPIGVSMLLQGPSNDFVLGRIFENAMRDAYDSIVKRDHNGLPLDPSKWVQDPELEKMKAKSAYLRGNCVLVK